MIKRDVPESSLMFFFVQDLLPVRLFNTEGWKACQDNVEGLDMLSGYQQGFKSMSLCHSCRGILHLFIPADIYDTAGGGGHQAGEQVCPGGHATGTNGTACNPGTAVCGHRFAGQRAVSHGTVSQGISCRRTDITGKIDRCLLTVAGCRASPPEVIRRGEICFGQAVSSLFEAFPGNNLDETILRSAVTCTRCSFEWLKISALPHGHKCRCHHDSGQCQK